MSKDPINPHPLPTPGTSTEHRQLLAGVGNQGIGLVSAQGQRPRRQQGLHKKPLRRSVSSPTPTAAPTGAGEGEDPQGGLQAEEAGAGAIHQQADLVALHHSSASVLAGEVALAASSQASSVLLFARVNVRKESVLLSGG